jgi:hypothetical protein
MLDLFVSMSFLNLDLRGGVVGVGASAMRVLGVEISGLGGYGVDQPFLWMLPASTVC